MAEIEVIPVDNDNVAAQRLRNLVRQHLASRLEKELPKPDPEQVERVRQGGLPE